MRRKKLEAGHAALEASKRSQSRSARPLKLGACLATSALTALTAHSAWALRNPDLSGDDAGAVAVYKFDEAGGTVANDTSGFGTPLNLTASNAGNLPTSDGSEIRINAILGGGFLTINSKPNDASTGPNPAPDQGYQSAQRHRTFLASSGPASKLVSCNRGFTIQAFVRPYFPFQGTNDAAMIVGLSRSSGKTAVQTPSFALGQAGQAGAETARLQVRIDNTNGQTTQFSLAGAYTSVREADQPGKLTELIATLESDGMMTVYVNRVGRTKPTPVSPVFDPNSILVIGNELVGLTMDANGMPNVTQQRNWSGEIHHLAIYCRGFSREEIQGPAAEGKVRAAVVRPQLGPISEARREARRIAERLAGVVVPIDHPLVVKAEELVKRGDRLGAAKIITGDIAAGEVGHPDFLNVTIKQMAMKMSNREETIRAPLNDFAAAFIGVTRDERNAKELLTTDFYYMADPTKAKVRSNFYTDFLVSNNHYEDLDNDGWDIGRVLVRVPGPNAPAGYPAGQQIATTAQGAFVPNPDPAGVLTSRAFLSEHAIAGTNRRLVEYAFKSFGCVSMAEIADTSMSTVRIGRDIDRRPANDATKFETNCKGCHTILDGFRGAFSRFDFADVGGKRFVRNTQVNSYGVEFGFPNTTIERTNQIVRKMNHNESVFKSGYEITDDTFVNNAIGANNRSLFGWSGPYARGGTGVGQFGRMLADSKRFSACLAKRAFDTVCVTGSKTGSVISPVVKGLADSFEKNGYNLRRLFQETAANPACLSSDGR